MADLTVLVVDDDALMLRMLAPRIPRLQTTPPVGRVLTAQTPAAALQQVDALTDGPLVVLSDFNLKAHINGVQLLSEVRERRPHALRILFSGYSAEQLGDVVTSGTVHGFVEKPLMIDEMLAPIERIIRENLG